MLPLHPRSSSITPFFPLHTQKQWGTPPQKMSARRHFQFFPIHLALFRKQPPARDRRAVPSRKAEGSWLAGVDDDPVGDGVPEGGFAEGKADLLDEDQGRSGPEGGAVNLAGGP